MDTKQILDQITKDLASKKVQVVSKENYRCYTDGNKEVIMTTPEETARNYYNTFINVTNANGTNVTFDELPRCTIFVGQPDTGKTYKAQQFATDYNVKHILIMARDNLNLETLLEDFTLVDGKPVFKESLAIQMLSGTEPGLIIIDEFNTLLTGVMKTLQPLLDNTSKTFVNVTSCDVVYSAVAVCKLNVLDIATSWLFFIVFTNDAVFGPFN